MDMNVSSYLEHLPFSGIRKILEKANAMERAGEHVIHLEAGRPDFDTPQVIKEACMESLRKGHVFYTSNYGLPELRQAIAEKLLRDNHIDYSPAETLVTVGLAEAVFDLMAAFINRGDEILIPDPAWLNYLHIPKFFGAIPVSYGLKEENNYQIDTEELKKKITKKTKIIVLISPNNPTGSVLSGDVVKEIAGIAADNDLLVVSDEIYEKLIYDGHKHVSIASLPGMRERTITLNGFSKAYSMTGWRIGYMAAPKEVIEAVVRVHQYNTACASSFVQEAAITALREGEQAAQQMAREYRRRRDLVVEAVNGIDKLSCQKPAGAFYVFVNIKRTGLGSEEMARYLLEEAKIALVPGSAFGEGGNGYLRLSYANSYENLKEACRRLGEAVLKL